MPGHQRDSANSGAPPRFVLVDDGDDAGWVAGGDCSVQGEFCSYAVVVLRETQLEELSVAIDAAIAAHAPDVDPGTVELHAKDIWNGSARRRTPFREIGTKDEMADLFRAFAHAIARCKPLIAVAVWHFDPASDVKDKKALTLTKQILINLAFGRVNRNLKILGNKNLGRPVFLFDRETENLLLFRGTAQTGGGIPDVELVSEGDDLEPAKFRRIVDPSYRETDSRASRLVQAADLTAYFICKYLIAHSVLSDLIEQEQFEIGKETWSKMVDANLCLELIETLNAEAVLAIPEEQYSQQPSWMRQISAAYQPIIRSNPHLCCCSMREAFQSPNDHSSLLNGVGYWLVTGSQPPNKPTRPDALSDPPENLRPD